MGTYVVAVDATSRRYPEQQSYANPGFPHPVSIINRGAVAVYLEDRQQSATDEGRPLSPGSTVIWPASTELWLVAPSATEVRISDSAGAMFDAGEVATQLLSQGLPEAIAQQVYVTGAPPVDRMRSLYSATLPQDGTTTWSPAFDTSALGTVQWRFRALDPATLSAPPGLSSIAAYWYDASMNIIGAEYVSALGDNNRFISGLEFAYGRLSVKGNYLVLGISTLNRPGGSVQFSAAGSIRSMKNAVVLNSGYYGTGGGTVSSYGLDRFSSVFSASGLAAGASTTEYPPVRSGLCTAVFSYNGTVPASGLDFLVQDLVSPVPIAGVRAAGGGASSYTTTQTFYMPDRPVSLLLRNKGPAALATVMSAVFTWEAE